MKPHSLCTMQGTPVSLCRSASSSSTPKPGRSVPLALLLPLEVDDDEEEDEEEDEATAAPPLLLLPLLLPRPSSEMLSTRLTLASRDSSFSCVLSCCCCCSCWKAASCCGPLIPLRLHRDPLPHCVMDMVIWSLVITWIIQRLYIGCFSRHSIFKCRDYIGARMVIYRGNSSAVYIERINASTVRSSCARARTLGVYIR